MNNLELTERDYAIMSRPSGYAMVKMGVNPYNWQIDAMDALIPDHSYSATATCNESGKFQSVDTLVITPQGKRRLGDLKVGDLVFGRNGKPCKVTGVYDQGEQDIYEFNFDNGEVFTNAGLDHLWWYMTPFRRFCKQYAYYQQWQVMTTAEIINKQGKNPRYRGLVPKCEPVRFSAKQYLISPYVMGCLIADGCFSGHVEWVNPDDGIIERFKSELIDNHRINEVPNANTGKATTFRITSNTRRNQVIAEAKRLGLWKKRSFEKHMPDEYKYGSIQQRIDLLRGLMDCDGTIGKKCNMQYDTSSERLANDVAWLVRSLGGKARITSRKPKYTYNNEKRIGRISYRVWVKLSDINPFYLKRKADKWYRIQITPERILYSVKKKGRAQCRCIRVDSFDSTYLTNDFIVTHNTSVCIR